MCSVCYSVQACAGAWDWRSRSDPLELKDKLPGGSGKLSIGSAGNPKVPRQERGILLSSEPSRRATRQFLMDVLQDGIGNPELVVLFSPLSSWRTEQTQVFQGCRSWYITQMLCSLIVLLISAEKKETLHAKTTTTKPHYTHRDSLFIDNTWLMIFLKDIALLSLFSRR